MKYLFFAGLLVIASCGDDNKSESSNDTPSKSDSKLPSNVENSKNTLITETESVNDSILKGVEETKVTVANNLAIAYYSLDILREEFKYYKEQDKLVIAKQKAFEAAYAKKSKALQDFIIAKEKEAQKGALSENQLIEIQGQIQKKQEAILKYQQTEGAKIEQEIAEKLMNVENKIEKIGRKFSEINKIDILIAHGRGGQYIYINPKLDVTKEFLIFLNENEKNF